jgi:hypothetical protein
MAGEPAYRRLYGCALVAIGLGSYFYHATLTFAGQVCDMSGMYLLLTFSLAYGLSRITRIRAGVALLSYVVGNLALLGFQMAFPDLRRYVFAGLVLGVLGMEAGYRRVSGTAIASRWLWYAAGTMAVAFLVWVLDITRAVCGPESVFQGHALWHVLCALSGWFLYRHYQSEVVLK